MLSKVSPQTMPNHTTLATCAPERLTQLNPRELTLLAAKGLAAMFDVEKQLFCFRFKPVEGRWIREGFSSRYTMMSLLGLHRFEAVGFQSPICLRDAVDINLRTERRITNLGDLGLALWLCSLASPDRLEEVYANLDPRVAMSHSREAREGRTMELAWFLSGLAHAASVRGADLPGISDLAMATYDLLKKNQGARGLFGHSLKYGTFAGVLRGHIGSFADQVYPIYGLAKFARVFELRPPLTSALECAESICRVQGALGQWWWHYNSRTGGVFEQYPVYSVHQHGMAPMALFEIAEAAGIDFSEPIYDGLKWIVGDNELGFDLRTASGRVVWRSIYDSRKYQKHLGNAKTLLGFSATPTIKDLTVKFECRPYELGWLLYAFAGREGREPELASPKAAATARY